MLIHLHESRIEFKMDFNWCNYLNGGIDLSIIKHFKTSLSVLIWWLESKVNQGEINMQDLVSAI